MLLQDIHFKHEDTGKLGIKDEIKYTIQTLIVRKFYYANYTSIKNICIEKRKLYWLYRHKSNRLHKKEYIQG